MDVTPFGLHSIYLLASLCGSGLEAGYGPSRLKISAQNGVSSVSEGSKMSHKINTDVLDKISTTGSPFPLIVNFVLVTSIFNRIQLDSDRPRPVFVFHQITVQISASITTY
jgi:hypothetical protein